MRVFECVCVCVRACTHAAGGSGNPPHVFKHKPGLLLPSLWSKPCSDGDPTLEDCDFLAHETHFRRGRGGGALCLAGRATHLRPQDRTEQDRTGASPEAGTGIAVGSGQLWSSSARQQLFLLSKHHSDTPGHFSMTPMALGQPSGAGDCQARQGAMCPASRPAPRPAPCGRRGLATLLLEARQWVRTLLDSALQQTAVPRSRSWKHQHSKSCRSRELHRWHQ